MLDEIRARGQVALVGEDFGQGVAFLGVVIATFAPLSQVLQECRISVPSDRHRRDGDAVLGHLLEQTVVVATFRHTIG